LSPTGADQAWAEWVAWQLEDDGWTTVLQAWDFTPGDNFVVRMRDALEQADRTIALLSQAYLDSPYAADEWTGAFLHDKDHAGRLLPVRIEACKLPRLLGTRVYIDLVGLGRQAARTRLLEEVKQGRRRPKRAPGFPGERAGGGGPGQPRFPAHGPEVTNLPARNPHFTGRSELLGQLRAQLRVEPGAVVTQTGAIHGLGGWARPSWRWSSPTATPPTTTSSGGSSPSSPPASPPTWPHWHADWGWVQILCRDLLIRLLGRVGAGSGLGGRVGVVGGRGRTSRC
jgi:hypothetical protein